MTIDIIQIIKTPNFLPNFLRGKINHLLYLVGSFFISDHSFGSDKSILNAKISLPSFLFGNECNKPLDSRTVKMFQATASDKPKLSWAGLRVVKSCHSQYWGWFRCSQIQRTALARSK